MAGVQYGSSTDGMRGIADTRGGNTQKNGPLERDMMQEAILSPCRTVKLHSLRG